jgi:pimeloyl-ACP methyl ester carboxylesterase
MGVLIPQVAPSPGVGPVELLALLVTAATLVVGVMLTSRRERAWVTRLRRTPNVLLLFLMFSSIAVSLVGGAALLGLSQRGAHFAHDQTTGTRKIMRRVVAQAGLFGTGVCRCAPDREARLVLPGGFTTAVSIYDRGGDGLRPGVVLLHGNTWYGRNLSLYRLLASRLAEEGSIVLTFDYVGKGQSDDPFKYGRTRVQSAFDFPAQTRAAIDYLINNTPVDCNDVSVFGHSGGGDWAQFVGLTHDSVSRVAMMAALQPPRDPENEVVRESVAVTETPAVSARFRETYRFVYGKPVPDWFQWPMTGMSDRDWNGIRTLIETPGHKPLLVLIGERDRDPSDAGVRQRFEAFGEPKTLIWIDRSDHYANSGQALGLVFYDRDVVRQLVGALVSWLKSTRAGSSLDQRPAPPECGSRPVAQRRPIVPQADVYRPYCRSKSRADRGLRSGNVPAQRDGDGFGSHTLAHGLCAWTLKPLVLGKSSSGYPIDVITEMG